MTGGLVLAAGGSSRFGSPKQLAEVDGRPLLQHAVEALVAVEALDDVVVVLGAEHESVASKVAFGRARAVVCPDWHRGQAASVRCGLSALSACSIGRRGPRGRAGRDRRPHRRRAGRGAAVARPGRRTTAAPGIPSSSGPTRSPAPASSRATPASATCSATRARFEAGHLADPHDIDTPQDLEQITP